MQLGEFEAKLDGILSDPKDNTLILSFRVPKHETYSVDRIVDTIKTRQVTSKERLKIACLFYKEKRSLNANAYFHVLVDKIAKIMKLGMDEVKERLVIEYGTAASENGEQIIAALPKTANVKSYYPYAKWIGDFTAKNGKEYSQYLFYKKTHTLDSSEMSKLIEGVVFEAKDLGIETRTPQEIAYMLDRWGVT